MIVTLFLVLVATGVKLFIGFLAAIPYLPCIWLCLGRTSSGNRFWLLAGWIGLFAFPFAAVDASLSMAIALHLYTAACLLLAWRYLVVEAPQFSLRALMLATLMLAVGLAVATPLMNDNSYFTSIELWMSLAILAPMPVLLVWASLALKRRLVVVIIFFLATGTLCQWWAGEGQPDWPRAWALLMMQAGFALGVKGFINRDELMICPGPIDQAGSLPDPLPSNHAFEGSAARETQT